MPNLDPVGENTDDGRGGKLSKSSSVFFCRTEALSEWPLEEVLEGELCSVLLSLKWPNNVDNDVMDDGDSKCANVGSDPGVWLVPGLCKNRDFFLEELDKLWLVLAVRGGDAMGDTGMESVLAVCEPNGVGDDSGGAYP